MMPAHRAGRPTPLDPAQPSTDTEARLRLALRAAGFGSWVWDAARGSVSWDVELEAVFGLGPGEFPGTYEAWLAMLHPDDRAEVVANVQEAMDRRGTYDIRHRVIWPDGSVHWVEGLGQVTVDADGEPTGTMGCTRDVTAHALVERALEVSAAQARQAAERSDLLQSVTAALAATMSVDDVARTLAAQLGGVLGATAAAVALLSRNQDTLGVVASFGFAEPETAAARPLRVGLASPMTDCIRLGRPVVVPVERLRSTYPEVVSLTVGAGHTLLAALPLQVPGRRLGALLLAFSGREEISPDDLSFVSAVAAQCSQAIERARLVERLAEVAQTLQAGLAPDLLPDLAGYTLASVYQPGGDEMEHLGGDWYDALVLADGTLALTIGDVMGRGVSASTTMTKVRTAARAYCWVDPTPAVVMRKMDAFVRREAPDDFITMVYATLDPATGAMSVVNAGHLPCVLLSGDGSSSLVKSVNGLPLGLERDDRPADSVSLAGSDALLLVTDGLVERRDRDLDRGLLALQVALGAAHAWGDPQETLDRLVAAMTVDQGPGDDITALIVRRSDPGTASESDGGGAVERDLQWHVVRAEGELDLYSAPGLREALLSGITSGHHRVVLDLSEVTFIDSSGFAVLVGALKRLRTLDGELRITGADATVQSAIRISGLSQIFGMYPDLAAATGQGQVS